MSQIISAHVDGGRMEGLVFQRKIGAWAPCRLKHKVDHTCTCYVIVTDSSNKIIIFSYPNYILIFLPRPKPPRVCSGSSGLTSCGRLSRKAVNNVDTPHNLQDMENLIWVTCDNNQQYLCHQFMSPQQENLCTQSLFNESYQIFSY